MLMWEFVNVLQWPGTQNMMARKDGNGIRNIEQPPGKRLHYSAELLNAVRDCLKIEPDDRPPIGRFKDVINSGLSKDYAEDPRVYYTNRSINAMGIGEMDLDWNFVLDDEEWIGPPDPDQEFLRDMRYVWDPNNQKPRILNSGDALMETWPSLSHYWPEDENRVPRQYIFGEDDDPRPYRLRQDRHQSSENPLYQGFYETFAYGHQSIPVSGMGLLSAWQAVAKSFSFQDRSSLLPATPTADELQAIFQRPGFHQRRDEHKGKRIKEYYIDRITAVVSHWFSERSELSEGDVRVGILDGFDETLSISHRPSYFWKREKFFLYIQRNDNPLA